MNESLRDNARSLLENWRKTLPTFRLKDEQARQAWDTYLDGCLNPHSREVARFVANWAKRIDLEVSLSSDVKTKVAQEGRFNAKDGSSSDVAVKRIILGAMEIEPLVAGISSQATHDEAIELMKTVSIWGGYVAWMERNPELWPL
ncbi:MAG: hypothetical protein AAB899_03075 [Patescibacteria group bacterium]